MKKRYFTTSILVLLLVAVLTLSLTGCRKTVPAEVFSDQFGLNPASHNTAGTQKIILVKTGDIEPDTPFEALDTIQRNYNKIENLAVKGFVYGDTKSIMTTRQGIFSTTVKTTDLGGTTIYHEDASISNSKLVQPSIVQMIQKRNNDKKTAINVLLAIADQCEGNGSIKEDDYAYKLINCRPSINRADETNFDKKEDYLAAYHHDLDALMPYLITSPGDINDAQSYINVVQNDLVYVTHDDGSRELVEKTADYNGEEPVAIKKDLICVNIVVNDASLQDVTKDKREIIALKSNYNNINVTSKDVTYKKLIIKFYVWPNDGYIRSMHVEEIYDLNAFGMIQTCTLFTDFYFSYTDADINSCVNMFKNK